MSSVKEDQLSFIIEKIIANAASLQKELKDKPKTQFDEGLLQGYSEVIDTIKNQMIVDEMDLKEYGLDNIDPQLFS